MTCEENDQPLWKEAIIKIAHRMQLFSMKVVKINYLRTHKYEIWIDVQVSTFLKFKK